jgi:hypothetical protein
VPGSLLLTLDTQAPQVEFGAVSGAEAGQLLQVAYTVDEPGVVEARFRSSSNQITPLTVHPDRVEGYLEPTTTGGNGWVELTSRDDVDNEAVWQLQFQVISPIAAPMGPPARGPAPTPTAPMPPPPERRRRRVRSRVRIGARTRATHGIRSRSRVEVASHSRADAHIGARSELAFNLTQTLSAHVPQVTSIAPAPPPPTRAELEEQALQAALLTWALVD